MPENRGGGGGDVVEAEPVEVATREQVPEVVLPGTVDRRRLEAGRAVRALRAHNGGGVGQVGRGEPRVRRPVERARDVLRVGVALREGRQPESVLDHLEDRLEAEDLVRDVSAPNVRRERDGGDAYPHLPEVLAR